FERKKEKARQIYQDKEKIYNPFFQGEIVLNSEGFHHLQYSSHRARNKEEQVLKFTLLPLGLRILKISTTVQEYRKLLSPVGSQLKLIEWWGFFAIFEENKIKVRVVVRRIDGGEIHFWSVMPFSKLQEGKDKVQKLFITGIEDE